MICSETNRHRDLVLAAAAAGKHNYAEKPLGITAAESSEMAEAVVKANVMFTTGYYMRTMPQHLFLRDQVQRGAFGREYDQIPLKAVPKMVTDTQCCGGRPMCLLTEQKLLVSFFVTTPLPSDSTIITMTFLGMTSVKDGVFRKDINVIIAELEELGYYVDQARKLWLSAN